LNTAYFTSTLPPEFVNKTQQPNLNILINNNKTYSFCGPRLTSGWYLNQHFVPVLQKKTYGWIPSTKLQTFIENNFKNINFIKEKKTYRRLSLFSYFYKKIHTFQFYLYQLSSALAVQPPYTKNANSSYFSPTF